MKQETKILIGLGVGAAVVGGLALAGYKYKQAAEALQFGMGGISPLGVDDNGLRVLINVKIINRSGFVFPVPNAFVKFNVAGKEVGAAQTTQWQTIGANTDTVLPLVGYFRLNELGGLITLLYNATTLPKEILYSGYVDFGKFQIPFNSSYAIGKYYDSTIKYGGRIDQYWTGNLENYAPSLVGRSLKQEQAIPFITDVETGVKHFGLHGIEFGNWMNQSDRLSHFVASMVSFQDLAHVLNINPLGIGVSEELTLALGARGQGGSAAAHYERGTRFVINITKTVGAGSLAHEYGHFLDNVMAVRSGDAKSEFASGGSSTRTQVNEDLLDGDSFKSLLEKIIYTLYWDKQGNPTIYLKRQKEMDSNYLFRRTEVFARTFEQYVRLKLRKHKIVNDYLVTRSPDPTEPPIDLVRLVEPYLDKAMAMLFGVNYSIGKTFKKKPTKVYKCRDGWYSDTNNPGACTWHGGMVDREKPIALCLIPKNKGKKTSDSKLAINDIPVSDVKIYLEKFQNRKNPFSEESVNRIIDAVENGTFRFEEFDPVLIWNSPDGNKYMLSGHSRLEAFTRLCNAGKLKFCNIPAKLIDVTAQEAEEIAMRSNTLSTKEKDTERALFYMKQIALGKPYRDVIETAKKTEGSNAARIVAYAYLNPIGKTFVALQSLEAGDPTSQTIIRAIGQWIGEARQKFPMLTNLHEDELYNWLIGGGFGKQYKNKADFLAKLAAIISQRTYFGEFDSNKPLNVTNQVTKSFSEKQFDAQVEELKDKVKEMEAQIKTKTLDYKSRGASEDQIYNLLQNDYGYLNRVRNQLLNLMQKKAEVIDSSKNELALFGLQSHSISGLSQKRFSIFL